MENVESEASSLLAEFGPKKKCKIHDLGRADLVDALIKQGAGSRTIERIFCERLGTPVSFNTVLRHQRRQCGCA